MDRIIAYKCVKGVNTKRGVGEAAWLARGVGQGTEQTPGRVGDSWGYCTVEQARRLRCLRASDFKRRFHF